MTKGRKRKPEKILKLQGTFQGCRRQKVEIDSTGKPLCPNDLHGEARLEWNRIVPLLDNIGILSKEDRAGLIRLCKSWANCVEAQKHIDEHGIVLGEYPDIKKNPACTVLNEAFSQWNTLCAKFGLTPSDREKMPVGKKKESNPFEEMLKKA